MSRSNKSRKPKKVGKRVYNGCSKSCYYCNGISKEELIDLKFNPKDSEFDDEKFFN